MLDCGELVNVERGPSPFNPASDAAESVWRGIALAFDRPAEQKKRDYRSLVLLSRGDMVAVKARDVNRLSESL
jgi:hypothetical protein